MRPAFPRGHPRGGAPLTSHDCPSVPASQLGLKCSWVRLALRRVLWLPYWEPSSRPLAFAA